MSNDISSCILYIFFFIFFFKKCIGAGWGTDTRILLQTFLVGMRDHFGDTERETSMYKVFL